MVLLNGSWYFNKTIISYFFSFEKRVALVLFNLMERSLRSHSYINFHGKVRHTTFWVYPHPLHQNVTLKNETLSCAIILSYHVMTPSSVCWHSMLHAHSAQQCYVEKLWPHTRRSLCLWYWQYFLRVSNHGSTRVECLIDICFSEVGMFEH